MRSIQTVDLKTKGGHTLRVFYNSENNLIVLDLIHKNGKGGNELFRRVVDIPSALKHCR